jgi:uncharacterized protein YodC (DUF2158 family)
MNHNVGDLVQLKSGGPIMTVVGTAEYTGDTICKWFDPSSKLQQAEFAPGALTRVEDDEDD